jgi:hypothetical protein
MKGMSRNPFVLLTLFAALTEAAVIAAPQANELNPEQEKIAAAYSTLETQAIGAVALGREQFSV